MFKSNKKLTVKLIVFALLSLFISSASVFSQDSVTCIDRLKEHLEYLASDELFGRFPGTEGDRLATKYITDHYKEYGLKPIGSSYLQEFEVTTGLELIGTNSVHFEVVVPKPGVPLNRLRPVKKNWNTGSDWLPVGFSESGSVSGEMVFAGYGITAKELKYDDYENVDVKDKVVIVLTHSPDGEKSDGDFAAYTQLRYKAGNARDHGAKGMIIIKMQGDSANVFDPLNYSSLGANSGIVAIQVNRTKIAKFFPRSQSLLPLELKINKSKKPESFVLPNSKIFITVEMAEKNDKTNNIIGMLKGTDHKLAEEYIVIGAHYDHLGLGGPTSAYRGKTPKIHNGADDNASGVAGLLELAKRISDRPMRRPVIFISFSAEEMGLLGSEYYVANPLVPNEKIVFMTNMDMIGRLKKENINLFGTGTSPVFDPLLDTLALVHDLVITRSDNGFGPSDHASFYKKDIPVLMYITGVHDDYHKPSDDWNKINFRGEDKVLGLIEDVLREIGNNDTKPAFSRVETVTENLPKGADSGPKVWFGIVPTFGKNDLGFKIGGTSAGSPAREAGLQENDIITEFAGKPIKNLYDLTYAIRAQKPGDVVDVKVLRGKDNSEVKTFKVKLVAKP